MDSYKLLITGGIPLVGETYVSGGKNTSVAVIAATLLYLGIRWAGRGSNLLASLLDMRLVWLVLLGTVLLGVVICVVSTLLVVRRVAYVSKDDLYY